MSVGITVYLVLVSATTNGKELVGYLSMRKLPLLTFDKERKHTVKSCCVARAGSK